MYDGEIEFLYEIADKIDSFIQNFPVNSKQDDYLREIYDEIIDRAMELEGE